jgi:hypothetical protein
MILCLSKKNLDWLVKIMHVNRESNKCLDVVASIDCQLGREIYNIL